MFKSISLFATGGGVCILLLLCLGICYSENAQSVQSALTTQDKQRLVELLKNRDFDSLQTAFYVSRGLKALGDTNTVSIIIYLIHEQLANNTVRVCIFIGQEEGL